MFLPARKAGEGERGSGVHWLGGGGEGGAGETLRAQSDSETEEETNAQGGKSHEAAFS